MFARLKMSKPTAWASAAASESNVEPALARAREAVGCRPLLGRARKQINTERLSTLSSSSHPKDGVRQNQPTQECERPSAWKMPLVHRQNHQAPAKKDRHFWASHHSVDQVPKPGYSIHERWARAWVSSHH